MKIYKIRLLLVIVLVLGRCKALSCLLTFKPYVYRNEKFFPQLFSMKNLEHSFLCFQTYFFHVFQRISKQKTETKRKLLIRLRDKFIIYIIQKILNEFSLNFHHRKFSQVLILFSCKKSKVILDHFYNRKWWPSKKKKKSTSKEIQFFSLKHLPPPTPHFIETNPYIVIRCSVKNVIN